MNTKERIYGKLGVDYQDEGFKAVGALGAGVDPAIAARQRFEMSRLYDSAKKVLSASKLRQSTPAELVEWLGGRSVTAEEARVNVLPYPNVNVFKREVAGEVIRAVSVKNDPNTKEEVATEVYNMRVVGGEFGYSGAETTVSMLTTVEGYEFDRSIFTERETITPEEFDDEWESKYTPTLHLERLTVGGTALFDELREAIELDKATVEVEVALAQPQVCEWYPDGEHLCTEKLTHARTRQQAGTCDACFAAREACGDSVAPLGVDL
jgi:hypothetical protein